MTRRILPFVVAALLLASACGSGASMRPSKAARGENAGATFAKAATVHLPKSYKFEPKAIDVAKGAVVTWVNEDDFPHTVHLLDGSDIDKKIGVGETASITFDTPGVYKYNCSLHPTQMNGSVTVHDSST